MATPAVDLKAPEFSPKNENPRERTIVVKKAKIGLVPTEQKAKVICMVECKPWAYVYEKDEETGEDTRRLRPLLKKEIVIIDSDVADVLCANEHAVRV